MDLSGSAPRFKRAATKKARKSTALHRHTAPTSRSYVHRTGRSLQRPDRRFLGGAVLAPRRTSRRLDHRELGLDGQDQNRISTGGTSRFIGLSVHPVDNHGEWAADIADEPGAELSDDWRHRRWRRWPEPYACRRGTCAGASEGRTPANNQTVPRCPSSAGEESQTAADLPDDHRPQLRRGAAGDQFPAADRQAPGGDAGELGAGRGRDHRRSVPTDEPTSYPQGWKARLAARSSTAASTTARTAG